MYSINNFSKYEALILGLEIAGKLGVKIVMVFGDFELVLYQIRNIYTKKNKKKYSDEIIFKCYVGYIKNYFDDLNIIVVCK